MSIMERIFQITKWLIQATLNIILQNKQNNLLKILLIGPQGQGKTKIFQKLMNEKIDYKQQTDRINQFSDVQINQNFCVVDTPSFDLESDIDIREQVIQCFQNYLTKNQFTIGIFIIVVKFERDDIMNQRLISVYKFLNKYRSIIKIAVTDFQLSESPEIDQSNLKKKFIKYVSNENDIIFINNNESAHSIINKIEALVQCLRFDLKDTILEQIQDDQVQEMVNDLKKKFQSN